ncbi:hypothetical protein E8E14_000970 [Neopestalotiopsis sp. 37M]|nr:hypothetical protein E8E14_000970 [Neopestalotiopsis sp. 37M]
MEAGWLYSGRQIKQYFLTRVTSLRPPRAELRNPVAVLRDLDRHQWLMFLVGLLGWVWDAFDFFTVSFCLTEIVAEFDTTDTAVSWGITVTLMLRSVGAVIFGALSDRYGRKWPMIINLGLFIVLELGTGFTQNLSQFLAVRSLYGIAMGGLYGPAAATALEDLPYDARGLLSGVFQTGYSMGYLLTAVFYRALVPTTIHGFRSLFWFGAGPPVLIIAFRWYLPETNAFLVMKAEREAALANGSEGSDKPAARAWLKEFASGLRSNWVLFAYLVILMTGYNSSSHGSQDLYPTFLKSQVGLSATDVTITSVVGQFGSMIASASLGWLSSFAGRRLTMITGCIYGAAVVPAYVLPRSRKLIASAFFQQFAIGWVFGPIPIYLSEMAPPQLRSTVMGLTYQLGNLASSASVTIQTTIGERFPLAPENGVARYDYGKVIGIFLGVVWVFMAIVTFLGPEMTQEERAEQSASANYLEKLRKDGVSLAEIGILKAKAVAENIENVEPGSVEKSSAV